MLTLFGDTIERIQQRYKTNSWLVIKDGEFWSKVVLHFPRSTRPVSDDPAMPQPMWRFSLSVYPKTTSAVQYIFYASFDERVVLREISWLFHIILPCQYSMEHSSYRVPGKLWWVEMLPEFLSLLLFQFKSTSTYSFWIGLLLEYCNVKCKHTGSDFLCPNTTC